MNTKVGTKERSASEGEDSTMSVQSPEHVEVLDLCAKQTEPREAQEAGIESEDYGNGRLHYQERVASGQMCSTSGQSSEYLCFFLHRLLAFRHSEVEALASKLGIAHLGWRLPQGNDSLSPLWYLKLPSDQAAKDIASESLLIKGLYEVWGEGEDWRGLEESIKRRSKRLFEQWRSAEISWKINVDCCFHSIPHRDQMELINKLSFLDFQGPVSLKKPDVTYRLIVSSDSSAQGIPENFMQRHFYFTREVACGERGVIARYKLPERVYIGPTSMDTEMAFLMCNMAKVRKGSLVYDPFVGTGSILIAATHLRAITVGADIDLKVIREGKIGSNGEVLDNWANFRQYSLPSPAGLLRMDAHNPGFRTLGSGIFDAVVCDPPYGVRAGGRRSLSDTEKFPKSANRGVGRLLHSVTALPYYKIPSAKQHT